MPVSRFGFPLPGVESICGACGTRKDEPSSDCWSSIVVHPEEGSWTPR